MSAELRTVKTANGITLKYDPDMEMGVLKNLLQAGQGGDIALMMGAMSGLVDSWSLDSDPKTEESWDSLKRSQFLDIAAGLMEDIGTLGEE